MIARLARNRYVRVAALAVGAVAVAGAAVVITASAAGMTFGLRPPASDSQSAVDAKQSSTACADFMKHFAVEMGKSQAEINAAFQKAIADTLADEVKSGKITQAQADALEKRLAVQTPCSLPATAPRGGGDKALGAYMQQYLSAAASALGITETQLATDLKGGQSLSQVAAAQHVSEADFRTRLIANLKPALDQAVTDKKLTVSQEQMIINRLQSGALPLWNKPAPRQPKPPATASPSPA